MQVRFADPMLEQLEVNDDCAGNYAPQAVRGFRKVMGVIRAAPDERDLYRMRSLNFEKLSGDWAGYYSLRLNIQWRLIVSIEKADPKNIIVVVAVVDYH